MPQARSPLPRFAVEVFHWNGGEINVRNASYVNRRHWLPFGIDTFGVGVNATGFAEVVLDDMFVEGVCADVSR